METLNEIRMRYAKTENITDAIYHTLDEAIVSGLLPPGARLLESELAEAMDVSRTPIREALKRLITDEQIVYSRHGNMIVKSYDVAEICDIIQALEGLRNSTTYFAAEVIDKVALARLTSTLDAIDAVEQSDELSYEEKGRARYKHDEMFHLIICESVGNEIMLNFYKKLLKKLTTIQNTTSYQALNTFFSESANYERRDILEALKNKDANKALSLSVKHSYHSFNRVKKLINAVG